MAEQLEIIAQHGWGFGSEPWVKWLSDFASCTGFDVVHRCIDRGYYSRPMQYHAETTPVGSATMLPTVRQSGARRVVITHSLGLHLLPVEMLNDCDLLVAFSSFSHFHDLEPRKSKTIVARMREKLDRDPVSVVRDFLGNCYKPVPHGMVISTATDIAELDIAVLRDDLKVLDENHLNISALQRIPRILLLHGTADHIVHYDNSQFLHNSLSNSTLVLFEGEGHALPFTNPAGCYLSIRQALIDCARATRPVNGIGQPQSLQESESFHQSQSVQPLESVH